MVEGLLQKSKRLFVLVEVDLCSILPVFFQGSSKELRSQRYDYAFHASYSEHINCFKPICSTSFDGPSVIGFVHMMQCGSSVALVFKCSY